jgi:hypothetical protein
VVGGIGRGWRPIGSAEVWDPSTRSFQEAESLAQARHSHSASVLSDGRVLIVGGVDGDDRFIADAEIWEPMTESFRPAGSLGETRMDHSASSLHDGRVLIVGGAAGDFPGDPVASAEIWTPLDA